MLFGKLLPREGNFFELFNQHAGFIAEGARAFIRLIQHYADPELRDKHASEVGTAERQADKITAEVDRLLHKTFITPLDREQIHGLINAMDDILDLMEDASRDDVAVRRAGDDRGHPAPRRHWRDVLRAGPACGVAAAQDAASRRAEAALKTCEEIDRLESDADRVMRSAMSRAVPRGDRRARADQVEGDLRACSSRSPTAAKTSPTSSRASSSRIPEPPAPMAGTEISFGVVAMLVVLALAFDFMNGFHDAANSIATVVSTGVLKPQQAVVFAAVLQLRRDLRLPPERRGHDRQGHRRPGVVDHHVIFGALIGAIAWNLVTW